MIQIFIQASKRFMQRMFLRITPLVQVILVTRVAANPAQLSKESDKVWVLTGKNEWCMVKTKPGAPVEGQILVLTHHPDAPYWEIVDDETEEGEEE